jgi:uncharacterized LabA/DUF88 family protein
MYKYFLHANEEIRATAKTLVFVDLENWLRGCTNRFFKQPDVKQWLADLKTKGVIEDIIVFADFSQEDTKSFRAEISKITHNVVDCSKKDKSEKDFTDFIMLHHIYRHLVSNDSIEQFVLFTGDAHFQIVVSFLRNFRNKLVGIYAIDGSLSRDLADTADWYVKIAMDSMDSDNSKPNGGETVPSIADTAEEEEKIRQAVLENINAFNNKKPGMSTTFTRTLDNVVRNYSYDRQNVHRIMQLMLMDNVLYQEDVQFVNYAGESREIRGLFVRKPEIS